SCVVYIYSKKLDYQSGRPDLNRRPLDPQSRSGRRWTSLSVAQRALDQPQQSPDVAGCRLMSAGVGSWFGSFAERPADHRPDSRETVIIARRAADLRASLAIHVALTAGADRSLFVSRGLFGRSPDR